MPRKGRIKSQTGIYHVIMRGNNQQQVFYDDEDFKAFIFTLKRYQEKYRFELYAYCLMGNHLHILMKTAEESLAVIFRSVCASYVYWYNAKYERTGYLFQDRFKSEPVEDERYFLCALRYILRNPVAAGICKEPKDYPYSNMKEIINGKSIPCRLKGNELINFINTENNDQCIDIPETNRSRMTDRNALKWIEQEIGIPGKISISESNRAMVEKSICRVLGKGVSIRQLARLSGLSKAVVEKALKNEKEIKEKDTPPSPVFL